MEWPSVKYYSLLWGLIITVVQIHGHGGCFEEERMGLLQFKEFVRTSGADADRLLPSWVDHASQSDCCGWERVTCNSTTGHVIELSLHNIKQLYNYTQYYDFFDDREVFYYLDDKIWLLNVSIFGAFKELRSLNLSLNEIGGWIENEGFESLSRLKRLETLDLGFNKLNMSTIQSLSAITSLKNLILNDNYMEGSFPAKELSALENLEMLNLSSNRLNGSLSQDLADIRSLKVLDLQHNFLNGVEGFAASGSLEILDLSRNMFDTIIPPYIWRLTSLKALSLSHNNFYGSLPSEGFATSGSLEILDLSWNMFDAIIPPYIWRLTSLKALSLSHNNFNGSLPREGLCKLEKLEEFDVSMNYLEGTLPSCINYNLTSLRLLDLSNNIFSGNISSSWIASLTSLQYIDISYNQFEGSFSFSSFANHYQLEVVQFICEDNKLQITEISGWIPLFQLQFLVLSNCLKNLSNEIPAFLFHQHNLRVADLSHNKLKGRFPGWLLENNTRLEYLSLTDNSYLGPFRLPLHLYNLSISWLDVSTNQFDGQLQENIGNLLPHIKSLNLSRNAFEGRLPSSIGNMSGMVNFDVSFNSFSGVVPKELVADCSQLTVLKLSSNNFHGDLFSTQFNLTWLHALYFNGNKFSGTLSKLKFVPELLDGSNNYLSGKIPSGICNETWLRTLILSYNLFEGPFQCENSNLEFLDLSHNFLSGSLPSWSGLDALRYMHFQGNKFSGSIPKGFINALINGSTIVTLDIRENNLSGSIPSLLGAVSSLRVLLLNGNSFGGVIPTQLCRLVNLSIMGLSNNYFSGSIPNCFHNIAFGSGTLIYDYISTMMPTDEYYTYVNLQVKIFEIRKNYEDVLMNQEDKVQFVTKHRTSTFTGLPLHFMSGLDLSGNNLTGPIPHELGRLASIHALNLSRNQLTGSIPKTFSNLTQIESLDLSHNKLSGEIPSELTGLHFLEVFTVAYNNLSGRIPDMKQQFSTFDETSYEKNPLLCGPPLKKSCTNVDEPPPSATKSNGKWYEIDDVVFFASFFVTYFMFFLGVAAFLYVNPYLQRRWFNLIEDRMYSSYYFVVDTLRRLSNRLYN